MNTPAFWHARGLLSTLLLPLAVFYEIFSTLKRQSVHPVRVAVPVICVGNLTAGGAGKTPVALAIGEYLKEQDIKAFYLSRGYGGSVVEATQVTPSHSAAEVGDEPLLLAKVLPTVVSKDRVKGARLAMSLGARAIVMDDGFQNPHLRKTLSLVVVDGRQGFGNGRLLPAGPLREAPEVGLRRAHAVILVNPTGRDIPVPPNKPVLLARTQPQESAKALAGKKVAAFCGLAYPHKFFDTLHAIGADTVLEKAFPDHHPYTDADLLPLAEGARTHGAVLVTTAKDFVRLPEAVKSQVTVVEITTTFERPDVLGAILTYALKTVRVDDT